MSHNEQGFLDRLRTLGYRLTPQRQLVLDALCAMGGHATIAQVYERVAAVSPAVDRATVYRSVHLFHKLGFVVSAEINGQTLYELFNYRPHHHLICRNCGSVAVLDDEQLGVLVEQIAAAHGFLIELNHLTLSGLCADCHAAKAQQRL